MDFGICERSWKQCPADTEGQLYLKMVIFSLPRQKYKGIFSDIYCENLVELLEVNLTKLWGPPVTGFTLEFLNFRVVHTEPPANHQLQFTFSAFGTGSHGGKCELPVCTCRSLQSWRQRFAKTPHFSYES